MMIKTYKFLKMVIWVVVFSNCINVCIAQSTNVQIIDLSMHKALVTDNPQPGDSVKLYISFKVNRADLSSKAHVYFGTTQCANDVYDTQADFILQGGKYYLQFSSSNYEIVNYHARIDVQISRQIMDAWQYLSVFVEDVNGNNSNILYYQNFF